jgi:hypothetical protein
VPLIWLLPLKNVTVPAGARPRLLVFTVAVKLTAAPDAMVDGEAAKLVTVVALLIVTPMALDVLAL